VKAWGFEGGGAASGCMVVDVLEVLKVLKAVEVVENG
jgi:hypothetical protein